MTKPKNKRANLEQRLEASKFEIEVLKGQIDERNKWLEANRQKVWEKEKIIQESEAEKKWKKGNYEATFTVKVRVNADDISQVEKLALEKAWQRLNYLSEANARRRYGMSGWSDDVAECVCGDILGDAIEIKKVKAKD